MRCEMPSTARRISLKRIGPFDSVTTMSTVHLSPIVERMSLTAVQSLDRRPSLSLKGMAMSPRFRLSSYTEYPIVTINFL